MVCSCGCHAPRKTKKEQIRELKEHNQRLTYQIVGTAQTLRAMLTEEQFQELKEKGRQYILDLEKCVCQRCVDAAKEEADEQ